MGTLSSPTKVKNIYQRLAFWTSATGQVALDAGKDQDDVPLFRPMVDISKFGIIGNLADTDQANFEAALTAAEGTTLVIDKPVSITANTTIGALNTLHFTRSGYLAVADGIKLTFADGCEFNDTIHQIFSFAGVIKVAGVINHEFWRVEWFGYERDDQTANCAECINQIFDEWETSGVGVFPRVYRFRSGGTYWTTDPFEIKLRTGSIMNDLVMESSSGSRWGGAILRQTDGTANVISGGTGSLVTRVAFKSLQFMGAGTYGADQTAYVVDASIIDLARFDDCGWFYCNRGLYVRDGGAGAQIYTNCYFVNLLAQSTMLINAAVNAKFVACIMENGPMTLNGNATEPLSLESCHIENGAITVPEATFSLRGPMGTTNGVTIKLMKNTAHCYVEAKGDGTYVYDQGHNNYVDGGYRYYECKGTASNVVQMAFPSTRDAGRMILQKDVEYIISAGVSTDAYTSGGASYNPIIYDMGTSGTPVTDPSDGTSFIDFGTITTDGNDTGYIPVTYQQEWRFVKPTTNVFLEPSHNMNLRVTRPLNANAALTGFTGTAFTDWQESGAADSLSTDGGTGLTNFVHVSTGTASTNYYQYVPCTFGHTYLLIMKITNNGGADLPKLVVGAFTTAVTKKNAAEFVATGETDEYMAMIMFRPVANKPTVVCFGHDASDHDLDFLIHFCAVVELGDHVRYLSDGLPEVGVFYKNDEIIDEFPTTNAASRYYCNVESVGSFGGIDIGCALNGGAWSSGASYTHGDCVSSAGVVYIARTTHSGETTAPASDTTNWKLIERVDNDNVGVIDGNSLFTAV